MDEQVRDAVRAILLTDDASVLLMRIDVPHIGSPFWITPGGGRNQGETVEAGLRRELREELGLESFAIGPLVWRRQHTFNWDGVGRVCQRELYHVVHTSRFAPVMSDEMESKYLDRFQWWSLDELDRAEERLTPLTLATIVRSYLSIGAPTDPPEWEVLVD